MDRIAFYSRLTARWQRTKHLVKESRVRLGNEGGRREFLLRACALGGLTAGIPLTASQTPQTTPDAMVRGLATANSDFFVRNHFPVPNVRDENWSLDIAGLVSKPLTLSYPDLLLMPSVRQPVTLECAGNRPGGTLVGTSVWSGVPLSALLKQADVGRGASTVVLHGADSGD